MSEKIIDSVKLNDSLKPAPHLLKIFKQYNENDQKNPQCEEIDFEEFGNKWLALFNYGAHEDHSSIPVMDWVEQVSKSPYRPVKLMKYVDGVRTQVALIPPLFDNYSMELADGNREYFLQLASKASATQRKGQREQEADAYIKRNITDRLDKGKGITTAHRYFLEMNKIFELYGVEREIPDWLIKRLNIEDEPGIKLEGAESSKETTSESSNQSFDGMMED